MELFKLQTHEITTVGHTPTRSGPASTQVISDVEEDVRNLTGDSPLLRHSLSEAQRMADTTINKLPSRK